MTRIYDSYRNVTCDTRIREEKDGWYTFSESVFYGEKGGMPADQGTINKQKVDGLRFEGETLWHHVEGEPLADPIHMEVDLELRIAHTAPQTALHILDNYYRRKGQLITSTNCHVDDSYYDLDQSEVTEADLKEAQAYINEAIRLNAPVTFSYVKGEDYPDPAYRHFDEVRIVTIAGLDEQPCGTPHVNSTAEIGSFVLLRAVHVNKTTSRIYFESSYATDWKLQQEDRQLHHLAEMLGSSVEELTKKAASLSAANKAYKKQVDDLQRQLLEYQAAQLVQEQRVILEMPKEEAGNMRTLSQMLLRKTTSAMLLYTVDGQINFAIVAPDHSARTRFEALKEALGVCSGGGSDTIVSGRTQAEKAVFQEAIGRLFG